jgi:hypothetical protein
MFLATSGIVDDIFNQQTANYTSSTACVCACARARARACVCVFCGVRVSLHGNDYLLLFDIVSTLINVGCLIWRMRPFLRDWFVV